MEFMTLYMILFGGSPISNVPAYEKMIQLVRDVYDLDIEPEGIKPRSFSAESRRPM
jgi:hypothetical protein